MIIPFASAVVSYARVLITDTDYVNAADAVYMAVATATDSDAIFSELSAQGALNGFYTTDGWYVSDVPSSARAEIASVLSAFHSVQTSVLAAISVTSTAASPGDATAVTAGAASTAGSATTAVGVTSTGTSTARAAKVTGQAAAILAAAVALGAAAL